MSRRKSSVVSNVRERDMARTEERLVQRWLTLAEACELLSRLERGALAAGSSSHPHAPGAPRRPARR